MFTRFAAKKFSNKQAIIILKKINIMFNKTIWILTFFLRDFVTNISLSQLVENLILYKFAFYISS